jgi:uncharacterized protein
MNHLFLLFHYYASHCAQSFIKTLSEGCQGLVKTVIPLVLSIGCSNVFYQPTQGMLIAPERFGFSPEEVWLKSKDGTKLHAWVFRAQKPKGTILQFHGNAENISTHFLNLAWLVKEGFDLLVFDYRGYGLSDGEPSQKGVYEDSISAMNWAFEDHKKRKTKHLIFFGQSLGGQILGRGIVDFQYQKDVSLLVLDSTFGSYKKMASKTLQSVWLFWPFSPLGYVLVSDRFASNTYLEKIYTPTIVMHAVNDPVVPFSLGQELFQRLKTRKWFWKVTDNSHTGAFHRKDPQFRNQFLELINQL